MYISFYLLAHVKPSSELGYTKIYRGNMAPSGTVSKTGGEKKFPGFCFLSSYWFPADTSPGQTQTEAYWRENMVVMISMKDGSPQAHVFKHLVPGSWRKEAARRWPLKVPVPTCFHCFHLTPVSAF